MYYLEKRIINLTAIKIYYKYLLSFNFVYLIIKCNIIYYIKYNEYEIVIYYIIYTILYTFIICLKWMLYKSKIKAEKCLLKPRLRFD